MKILLLSHISEAYAPTFPFLEYLKNRGYEIDYIFHPLANTSIAESIYKQYSASSEKQIKIKKYASPINNLQYLNHFFLNLKWLAANGRKYDIIFGLNCINCFSGIILKFFGKTKKVVYYTVDYSTQRFDNYLLNKAYLFLDKFCARHSDFTFSVSERIREVRKKQGLEEKRNILQPNGVHLNKIPSKSRIVSYPIKVVYAGHLTKSKGIHLFLEALSLLKNKNNFILDIFGNGPYKENLSKKIKNYGLSEIAFMRGNLPNEILLEKFPDYDIGIALYNLDDQFNYYCDPVKIKEYIGAKNIILVSNVPEIAEKIENLGIGFKIKNEVSDILKKMEFFENTENILKMRKNFNSLDIDINWKNLYDKNLNIIKNEK